jgi:hypothetical protein
MSIPAGRTALAVVVLTLVLGGATFAAATVTQSGALRVSVNGRLSPTKLPRQGLAPISVQIGWDIGSTDGSSPPKLKSLQIDINRHGKLDYAGLPACPVDKIQPATTQRALSNCRRSLVGRGTFRAEVALPGQEGESYETKGQLLIFKSEVGRKPVLYGQIYSAHPFASSFVIPFQVKTGSKGVYGTMLAAKLPTALRSWGSLNAIELKLERTYAYKGARHSFLSAGCPAPKGFTQALFKLARTSFAFDDGRKISSTVSESCRIKG